MLQFLQLNAEWICAIAIVFFTAIAIVFFTAIQCYISHSQYKQELRLRRLNLAKQMDGAIQKSKSRSN